ncbi:zinc finger and BTB domain-containing protein 40 isoform X3 [Pezoporus flaviventris]|uniref:zinc finger and BTB domain-containing protein 40 isoform X3 n=1 Tax=Pezoporus flaviventris TaxID=889875 RepID=UPI002AB1659F|nr:zinc finger and BTB domain-containing protein 40 isoform X3 [Pezoporus flaviventris]
MELPGYSRQLLQQLYTLCKEQQFCDCTIFIGNVHFRAHKVVLAAASLLFKSLLDSTDTISIDASVVTPEEFALLLEMMYSGKLPLGKHNFTKTISVADSLQMGDMAVSCKNLLRDLISCSTQDQVVNEVSSQAADSSENHAEANNLPQSEKTDEGKTDNLIPQRLSPFLGPEEAEVEADVSPPGQELAVNHTWVHQDGISSDTRSLHEGPGSHPDQPACAKQVGCAEEELPEPPEEKGGVRRDLAADSESCKLDFFLRYESIFSEALSDAQAVLNRLEECREIDASQKEALVSCLAEAGEQSVLKKLLSKVKDAQPLDAQTLVSLLKLFQDTNPKLRAALLEREQGNGEALHQGESTDEGETLTARLLGCREELIQSVTQLSPILEFLEAAEEGFLTASEKRVVLDCCGGTSQREAVDNLLRKVDEEKTLKVESLVKLLGAVKTSFPGLHPLLDNLVATANVSDGKVANSGSTAVEIILQHSKLITEAIQKRGDLEGLAPEEAGLTEAVKELLSISAQKESSEASLKAALSTAQEKSVLAIKICQLLCNVHESFPDLQPVMQELGHVGKMYACQYCDAVFAQSIELSRHVRTHTGDKPYVCRECGKGFRQANGLSIHLRSFHNIEDPYDCKKCRMSFATLQEHRKHVHEAHSREYHPCPTCSKVFSAPSLLERHMVTHVGGKPFSCEICDKAYQQLSGLWYHNRTHHPDVFAAQNHRSSKFSSLQCSSCDKTFSSTAAHRKHVKAEHTDVKFHECETCKEQFPTLALLQVHVKCRHSGSQPFRCLYCSASFHLPGALQNHVTSEHFKQKESTFPCELCGELFPSQGELEEHCSAEHPKVLFSHATTAQIVQVIQTSEQGAAQHIISFDDAQLAGSQVFVTLPESQVSQTGSELVAVTMEDLFDDKIMLICEETK